MMQLTLSDVERLVKAGITLSYAEIKDALVPDYQTAHDPSETKAIARYYPLVDAFMERWTRNIRATQANQFYRDGSVMDFQLNAATTGDKVVCLISDNEQHIVLEDPVGLYPSDALMASIHLWLKAKA